MNTRGESLFIRNPEVSIEDFGDRSLVFHCTDLRLLELNAVAKDILFRLNGETTVGQLAAEIADTYNQPMETMLSDVKKTLTQMADLNIIRTWNGNGRQRAVC